MTSEVWERKDGVRLRHVGTGHYLAMTGNKYQNPIPGEHCILRHCFCFSNDKKQKQVNPRLFAPRRLGQVQIWLISLFFFFFFFTHSLVIQKVQLVLQGESFKLSV